MVTARADVEIFNNTLAVCFLVSGPWPVNPMKYSKKERNGIDLKLKKYLGDAPPISDDLDFDFVDVLIISLDLFSYLTHCNENMFSTQAVAL